MVLGGGRKNFLPTTVNDESGLPGLRTDNVNLIELWKASKGDGNATFITTKVSYDFANLITLRNMIL